jgi:NADH-quinone oxidoreductase subunit D
MQSMAENTNIELGELAHLFSPRALTGETMVVNMGPQHPSTHGVLRLILEVDGERIVNVVPDIGFLHTGIEKNMEAKTYLKAEVMTDRMDYMNPIGNNLTYCLAIEKLTGLDVPDRASSLRVILAELQRIASHLLWIGTTGLDLAAMSTFLYAMREREMIMDIFELVSGQRMMTTFIRPGGVWRDVPAEFETTVKNFIGLFPARIDEYEALLTKNAIFKDRTVGIGRITGAQCIAWGVTGPILRGSGVEQDTRRMRPYCGYEQYDFEIPTQTSGDIYGRYLVRVEEMRQSVRIIRQALEKMPYGPVHSNDRKYFPPPRSEIGVSMEALIHHFKLWTEGFIPPAGYVYAPTESPHGEMGCYLESDGSPKPYRVHFRSPSLMNLQIIPLLSRGHLISDLVGIIGSIDLVLGDVDR